MCTFSLQWAGSHGGVVMTASYSMSDQLIVSGTDLDYNLYLWDTRTGAKEQTIKGTTSSFSTNCFLCPVYIKTRFSFFQLKKFTKKMLKILLSGVLNSRPTCCIFTPSDDRLIITSMDRTARFFDLRSGRVTITLR